jgi:hypothetical protein
MCNDSMRCAVFQVKLDAFDTTGRHQKILSEIGLTYLLCKDRTYEIVSGAKGFSKKTSGPIETPLCQSLD